MIKEGEIVTLIGSNGAGKSTILKVISGLIVASRGTIHFNGRDIVREPVHKRVEMGISMTPEGRGVLPEMTVLENLELGAFVKSARAGKDAKIKWVFDIFPILRDRINQRAGTLSGGEQQMLSISKTLMSAPRLLLLDEISLGIAPILVQNIFRVLQRVNESTKIAMLLVEQNVQLALRFAARAYIIETGRVVVQGETGQLLRSGQVKDLYFGIPSSSGGV